MKVNEKYSHLEDKIVKMYKSGSLLKDVANEIGCSETTVVRYLRKNNVKIDNHKLKINEDDVIRFYSNCKSLKKTAEEFKVCMQYIRPILLKSTECKNLRAKNWDKTNDGKIVKLYQDGLSAEKIGDMYNVCHTTILRHLQRLGVVKRKTSNRTYHGISQAALNVIKQRAINKGKTFNVTKKYLDDLLISQGNKCAVSGLDIKLPSNYTEMSTGVASASLDRIDSSKGYVKGNVQWVDKRINFMKQSLSDQEFIGLCKTISDFNS